MLTHGDRLLIVLYILGIAGSAVVAAHLSVPGVSALVTVDGRPALKLDLSQNQTVTVYGSSGEADVHVEGGGVSIGRSTCPNKVCVRTGRISRAGEVILCAPNRILIRILGKGTPRAITG